MDYFADSQLQNQAFIDINTSSLGGVTVFDNLLVVPYTLLRQQVLFVSPYPIFWDTFMGSIRAAMLWWLGYRTICVRNEPALHKLEQHFPLAGA